MAGADVIEAAIGITLLLIVSYVVLGSITTAADTVSAAKKDMTLLQEERLGTNIDVTYARCWTDSSPYDHYDVDVHIKNTGDEFISDISDTGIVIIQTVSNDPIYCKYTSGTDYYGTWTFKGFYQNDQNCHLSDFGCNPTPEVVNPNQWDPGEYLYGEIYLIPNVPVVLYAFTGNGATDGQDIVKS